MWWGWVRFKYKKLWSRHKDSKVPTYDKKMETWIVNIGGRYESGELDYVVSEYVHSGLCYRFNDQWTAAQDWNNHAHSFNEVLNAVLDDENDAFSIEGFEEDYSVQEIELIRKLQNKLREDGV